MKKFTLDRRRARELEDLALAEKLSEWVSKESGKPVTAETLCAVVEEGVVLCALAKKFGQTTRYWDPPKNEFQRRENIALFARACSRLSLSCEPIPSRRDLILRDIVPCLMELAALAKKNARTMRRIVSTIPEDLQDRIDHENGTSGISEIPEDLGELEEFSMKIKDDDPFRVMLSIASRKDICWGGAQVMMRDILIHQRSRFLKDDHQVLCLGVGVTLCGLWAAMAGSDVVLTDFPKSIDLIWANVAANADNIRKAGGSCGARSLHFKNFESDMATVVSELNSSGDLTVLASDACHNAKELSAMVSAIFAIRNDARFFIVCQHDHVFQEFFQSLKGTVSFLQVFGDLEYRIIKGEASKPTD